MSFDLPVPFQRIYKGALDPTTIFTSLEELDSYVSSNGSRYAGQIVSVVNSGTVTIYKINADESSYTRIDVGLSVTSVNLKTGDVVLTSDDISDSSSVHKFITQAQIDDLHIHQNKTILDDIEESFTTDLLNKINSLTVVDGGTF